MHNNQHQRGGIMKLTIVTLACLLLAPLAFAQPSSTNKKQTTTEPVTVTGALIKMTAEEGAAASYQPIRTLVIREDNSKNAARYVVNGRGHVLNKAGQVVQTAIKPGARVRVYYANTSDLRTIDHVVLLD
jgi:tRNA splicing endonuclease